MKLFNEPVTPEKLLKDPIFKKGNDTCYTFIKHEGLSAYYYLKKDKIFLKNIVKSTNPVIINPYNLPSARFYTPDGDEILKENINTWFYVDEDKLYILERVLLIKGTHFKPKPFIIKILPEPILKKYRETSFLLKLSNLDKLKEKQRDYLNCLYNQNVRYIRYECDSTTI